MLDISHPGVGVLIVTVESVIVLPLSVVGVLNVTVGGKLIVFELEFPAVSYTITVILWSHSSGSKFSTTGLVTGSSVVDHHTVVRAPSSLLYVIVYLSTATLSSAENVTCGVSTS